MVSEAEQVAEDTKEFGPCPVTPEDIITALFSGKFKATVCEDGIVAIWDDPTHSWVVEIVCPEPGDYFVAVHERNEEMPTWIGNLCLSTLLVDRIWLRHQARRYFMLTQP